MRKVYLAIALGFFSQGIQAQQSSYRWKVEAEAGVSCSVLDTDVSGLSETYYKVRPGFTAAIGAEYNIVDQLAVGAASASFSATTCTRTSAATPGTPDTTTTSSASRSMWATISSIILTTRRDCGSSRR